MKRRNLLKAIPAFLATLFLGRKIKAKRLNDKPQVRNVDYISVDYNKDFMYHRIHIIDKGEDYRIYAKEGRILQSFNESKDSEEFAWPNAKYSEQGARCSYVCIMKNVIEKAQKGDQFQIDFINTMFDDNKKMFFEILNINQRKGN